MTYTISDGTTTLTPLLVLDYTTFRAGRSVVHDVLGSGNPDVTLRPMASRSGVLNLFVLTAADAQALETLHMTGLPMTYVDPANYGSMQYVVDGSVTVTYLAETNRWTVAVGYREVAS